MVSVFILWHVQEIEGSDDDSKLVGVYSSPGAATAAIARLRDQPGFRNYPEGFQVHKYEIDRDHWVEGFTTMVVGKPLVGPGETEARGKVGDKHETKSAPNCYFIMRSAEPYNSYVVYEGVEYGLTTKFEVYRSSGSGNILLATLQSAEAARILIERDHIDWISENRKAGTAQS